MPAAMDGIAFCGSPRILEGFSMRREAPRHEGHVPSGRRWIHRPPRGTALCGEKNSDNMGFRELGAIGGSESARAPIVHGDRAAAERLR